MMIKLDAKKVDGKIVISEDSFEHLLNCLDNQKFVGAPPPCGDAAELAVSDPQGYKQVDIDIQNAIDDFSNQCRQLLNGPKK